MDKTSVKLWKRQNGDWAASIIDVIDDTGHHIVRVGNDWTVYSIHDTDKIICDGLSGNSAQAAILADWQHSE